MRQKILHIIHMYWNLNIFPGLQMSKFFIDIYKFIILLDSLRTDDKDLVAIHGKRSKKWIALYLASWIVGIDFMVIPYNLSKSKVLHLLGLSNVKYYFTQPELIDFKRSYMRNIPFVKSVYDIDTLRTLAVRNSIYNNHIALRLINKMDTDYITRDFLKEIERSFVKRKQSNVISITPGITSPENKMVVSTADTISNTVDTARGLLNWSSDNIVYSEVDFANSHIFTVLLPFVSAIQFCESREDATIVVESTQSMEEVWYKEVDSILESKFMNWLFKWRICNSLFKRVAKKRLQRFYEGVEHVVVYNGNLHERCLDVATKALPLIITHGSQETNQLYAITDFSQAEYEPHSLGVDFCATLVNGDNEIRVLPEFGFSHYLGDAPHTNYVKDRHGLIRTGDVVNYPIFLGRKSNSIGEGESVIQIESIENHIRSLPWVKNCVLVQFQGDDFFNLMITVEERYASAHGLGFNKLESKLGEFIKSLNKTFREYNPIMKVAISYKDFEKGYDGKIMTWLYRPS